MSFKGRPEPSVRSLWERCIASRSASPTSGRSVHTVGATLDPGKGELGAPMSLSASEARRRGLAPQKPAGSLAHSLRAWLRLGSSGVHPRLVREHPGAGQKGESAC